MSTPLECLRLLATLKIDPARSKLIGGFIDSYLSLTAEEERQHKEEFARFTPKERNTTMALVSSWEQKGIDQGKEEVVLRLIRKRFGAVPISAAGQIGGLTSAQLDDLAESLLDFNDAADLERWLAKHPSN